MFETIILIILIMFIIIYKLKNNKSKIILIDSYYVNDLPDSKEAANTLNKIMTTLNKLVNKILEDKKNKDDEYIENVKTIKERLPFVRISENPTDSNYTSYSINKGEELVFCIRDYKKYKIHSFNELLYVAIHEIAHIGCPEIGHGSLFQSINLYLLEKAVEYNIYKYVDYEKYNKKYCGMTLTSTILNKE